MTRTLRAWGPPLAWAALIFWASSRQSTGVDLRDGMDKFAHFGVYSVLGLLLALAARSPAVVIALGALYGISDEVHQMFVPGRTAELADWFADVLGVLVGLFVYRRAARRTVPAPSTAS